MRLVSMSLLLAIACTASTFSGDKAPRASDTSTRRVSALEALGAPDPGMESSEICDPATGDTGGCLAQRQLGTMIERLRQEYPEAP